MKIKLFEEFDNFNLEDVASGLCDEVSDILGEGMYYEVNEKQKFIRISTDDKSYEFPNELQSEEISRNMNKLINEYKLYFTEIKDWYFIYFFNGYNFCFSLFVFEGQWIKDILNSLNQSMKLKDSKRNDTWSRKKLYFNDKKQFIVGLDENKKQFNCSTSNFWKKFETFYGLDYSEISFVTSIILNKHFGKSEYYSISNEPLPIYFTEV